MSLKLYAALGPQNSKKAFVHYPANTFPGQEQPLKDDTHFNAYGAYQVAGCIVEGINLMEDTACFDPARPDAPETWSLPASPLNAAQKPEGG